VRRLSGKAVELGGVSSISPTTIHELLKKMNSSTSRTLCLPSVGGEFVVAMEDVLDLYEEP
jgi:hypothetical protein